MGDVEEVQGRKDITIESNQTAEEPEQHKVVSVPVARVSPRTITGPANAQNQGAIDW